MPYLPLEVPPGIKRPGTKYDARGRWFDSNLVRWHEDSTRPVGGWEQLESTTPPGPIDLGEPIRTLWAYKLANGDRFLFLPTLDEVWAMLADGSLFNFPLPPDFVPGNADATVVDGNIVEAQTWQIDNLEREIGALVLAWAYSDKRIFYGFGELPGVPTDNSGVVVTPEHIVVALGAGGNGRLVAWSDQEDATVWAPTPTNQAGSFPLTTQGVLLAGRRSRNETLLWTDDDIWAMRYIGGDLIYSFQQLGADCGAISRQSMHVSQGVARWMGNQAFFTYDGFVRPLSCEVADYVFGSLNRVQASKIVTWPNPEFNEITWHYPSEESIENDRYVTYDYLENHWSIGTLERTAGVDSTVFGFPIAADSTGKVYQHEIADGSYVTNGVETLPFLESGPIEVGRGDNVYMVREIIPDANTQPAVTMRIFTATFPVSSEVEHGPFAVVDGNPVTGTPAAPVRMTGRTMRLRIDHGEPDWRIGTFRLEAVPGGLR